MTYFVATWNRQLPSKAARKRAEAAMQAIDPSADLIYHDAPGNQVRMWIQRPNDGTNDYRDVRARNQRLCDAVTAEMER